MRKVTITKKEIDLIESGQWILAIKSVRERSSLYLLEARRLVDAYRSKGQKSIMAGSDMFVK